MLYSFSESLSTYKGRMVMATQKGHAGHAEVAKQGDLFAKRPPKTDNSSTCNCGYKDPQRKSDCCPNCDGKHPED